MTRGEALAKAAAGFIGAPFRLHGRSPAAGLDCIGLVVVSLEAIGLPANPPTGYAIRNRAVEQWLSHAASSGLVHAAGPIRAGDILLTRPGPAQHHLMIAENALSAIHAHAGLRRVVRQPLSQDIEIAAHWRLAD